MVERKIGWAPQGSHTLVGGEVPRVDGKVKASGHAKYTHDMNSPGTLFAKLLTSPHAHAKVALINLEKAKGVKGVKAVLAMVKVGDEIRYEGWPIVAIAAERPEYAEDGLRAVEVKFDPLPHYVDEANLKGAEAAEITDAGEPLKLTRTLGVDKTGDTDKAIRSAAYVHRGFYGVPTITHMCLEPHGSHAAWKDEDLQVALSTQNVSGTATQYALPLGVDAARVAIRCDFMGGGFGSKFAVDAWDVACARLAKVTGRPVRLMLNRSTEMQIAGNRPSAFAEVTVACDAEGHLTAWESHHWGTSGPQGSTIALGMAPYLFKPSNRTCRATGIATHCGPERDWRAPHHPQACALTQTALDDLAAKAGLDSLEFFRRNLDLTSLPHIYRPELEIAARLMDWETKWHPRGQGAGRGAVKRGVGVALHTWGGGPHQSNVTLKVHPDGTIEVLMGTQDNGTGTRTCIAQVTAETFGVPMTAVKVSIGSNQYPQAGPSGGSTTIGGVSGPVRRTAQQALWKILDLAAAKYGVDGNSLIARDGRIWSAETLVCTWKQAAGLIGPMPLELRGGPVTQEEGLTSQQVGGVQMAEVAVDIETGVVRIVKMVAVQDMGLIVNRLLARSQVSGGLIMGIAYALSEERIMDNKTGRFINANFNDYKLPRMGDIGELVVEFYEPESEYNRGVIGLGEPPVISPGAAISNAVANAIGVRVPVLPLTPKRVLDVLKGANR
jgi:xanthine dehydrogenase YagR molybdenum-binding subunit